MACGATLKRSWEFDPVHSPGRSPKRLCLPKELMSPTTLSKQQHLQTVASSTSIGQFTSSHSLSSPPHSPASKDSVQTSSTCLTATSVPDSLSSVLKSPLNCLARSSALSSSQPASKEQPLLTLSQVDIICRRVVQEHEEHVREQFDRVLNHKLSEQYESFLKFNHDQLKRRFENQVNDCSYVS